MKAQAVKKLNRVGSFAMFALVLIFGIVFLTLFLKFNKPVPDNYVETQATITKIEEERLPTYDASDGIGPEDFDHRVFIEYSYDNKVYPDNVYGYYNSSMKKGDTVLIYVNPDNPAEFMSDPSEGVVFVIVGIVIILVGLGGLGYQIFQIKKEKENN